MVAAQAVDRGDKAAREVVGLQEARRGLAPEQAAEFAGKMLNASEADDVRSSRLSTQRPVRASRAVGIAANHRADLLLPFELPILGLTAGPAR